MTNASKNTIVKLLADAGNACLDYQDRMLQNLPCKRIQADEIWSFVYSKQKNVPEEKRGQFGYGDVWTWTAIDADTKLIVSWYLGRRDGDAAYQFMTDLAGRLINRVQLTTDGHHAYLNAVDEAFDRQIDYAMLVKQYGTSPESEKRYSPPVCYGASAKRYADGPTRSTSAQATLSGRIFRWDGMRRFTRLTNGFQRSSKTTCTRCRSISCTIISCGLTKRFGARPPCRQSLPTVSGT